MEREEPWTQWREKSPEANGERRALKSVERGKPWSQWREKSPEVQWREKTNAKKERFAQSKPGCPAGHWRESDWWLAIYKVVFYTIRLMPTARPAARKIKICPALVHEGRASHIFCRRPDGTSRISHAGRKPRIKICCLWNWRAAPDEDPRSWKVVQHLLHRTNRCRVPIRWRVTWSVVKKKAKIH